MELEPVPPYPGFERPIVYEIPEQLPDEDGRPQSTTHNGERPKGRVILYTSREHMPNAYKKLRPRWKVTYRTERQMIGSKPVSELVPATPGSYFVFATVELSALEPDYVALGRIRPNEGPLIQAVDRFVTEKIRELAKEINDRRRHEQDQEALDAVHEENRRLDNFKNRFLPSGGLGGNGSAGQEGKGPRGKGDGDGAREPGDKPEIVEFAWEPTEILRLGKGVNLHLATILRPRVRDAIGRLVPNVKLEWYSADRHIIRFENGDLAVAAGKGTAEVWARVKGMPIESPKIRAEVWVIDHVLLTPRTLEIPLGKRKQIIAEVTNDETYRATNVLLNWKHDADDPMIARVHPSGWVTGNRLGRTSISAGAGDPGRGDVWARIPAEVTVIPNPEELERGQGFPQLLLTGRDTDPDTGETRPGNPDEPSLWQAPVDYVNNIWWLNTESPEAAFFFAQRADDIRLWRAFHAQKVVEMVIQVHMQEEFTKMGDAERKDLWVSHKSALERYQVELAQSMWEKLQSYVQTGGGLE